MDEKRLIAAAKKRLKDQDSPLVKAELRREADGTPYVMLLQDQGIGGVKKYAFPVESLIQAEAAEAEEQPSSPTLLPEKEKGDVGEAPAKRTSRKK